MDVNRVQWGYREIRVEIRVEVPDIWDHRTGVELTVPKKDAPVGHITIQETPSWILCPVRIQREMGRALFLNTPAEAGQLDR